MFNIRKVKNLHLFSPEEVGILANNPENLKTSTKRIQLVFSLQNRSTRTTAYTAPLAGSAPVDNVWVCWQGPRKTVPVHHTLCRLIKTKGANKRVSLLSVVDASKSGRCRGDDQSRGLPKLASLSRNSWQPEDQERPRWQSCWGRGKRSWSPNSEFCDLLQERPLASCGQQLCTVNRYCTPAIFFLQ